MTYYEVNFETESIEKGRLCFVQNDATLVQNFIRFLVENFHEIDISVYHVDMPISKSDTDSPAPLS